MPRVIQRANFDRVFDAIRRRGYQIFGPTVREGALAYDRIESVAQLPVGWSDEQGAGSYRLKQSATDLLFGYTLGQQSWKKFLFPSVFRLWRARRQDNGFVVDGAPAEVPRFAFMGVRACELQAIALQDRVFQEGLYVESSYSARREQLLILAVNCGQAGGTCFCVSMGAGPQAEQGYDLALTEISEDNHHYFVVDIGTDRGADILNDVPHREATTDECQTAAAIVARTAAQMGRHLDTRTIREFFYDNLDHLRWNEIAARCLACGNCTMVCPTCFCSTVQDSTDLAGEQAERWRIWDSCFSTAFSYIHGGSVRTTLRSRYRQWLMHKLATWIDQFGTTGCVGCGRCITWCPVGIDMTEEIRAMRGSNGAEVRLDDGNA